MKTKLKNDEELVLIIRKHWLVLLKPSLWTVIFLAISITLVIVAKNYALENADYIYYAAGLLIVIVILWFTYKILERRSNLWGVTNFRVIDEYGVFTNNSKETPLEKINNVSYRQPFLGRVFNYGNVQIQSAAEAGSTLHKMVSRPKSLKDTITQYQEEYRQEQIKKHARSLSDAISRQTHSPKEAISEEIMKLHDLKEKGIITEEDFLKLKNKLLNN